MPVAWVLHPSFWAVVNHDKLWGPERIVFCKDSFFWCNHCNQKTVFFLPFGLVFHCLLFCHWTASWGCTSVFLPLLLTNCESIKMVLLQWHGWFSAGKVQLVNYLKSNQDLFSYFCLFMFFFFLACILNPIVFFAHQIFALYQQIVDPGLVMVVFCVCSFFVLQRLGRY